MNPDRVMTAPASAAQAPAAKAPAPRRFRLPAAPAVAVALALVALWEALCGLLHINTVILPAPSDVAAAVADHWPALLADTVATASETVAAFVLAAALGIAGASALTLSTLLKEAFYPYLVALQTVPKIALAPLFTVWLSVGFTSRLAIAVFVSVFSILVPLMSGLRQTPPDTLRLARCCGAGRLQVFLHIRFPYALDFLFSGLKIAATTVVIGVVVGEFISSDKGLGHLIMYSAARMETPMVMAAVLMLCALGLALYGAVAWADGAVRRRMS
ncbi:ABC transporter permease [Pigmentiphaga soli]|uniref:ABC transporter permease n=1 Tax=Pigmentiphaga soli TaxID=1007095 RepID=A0ABP8GGV9_9BURK